MVGFYFIIQCTTCATNANALYTYSALVGFTEHDVKDKDVLSAFKIKDCVA